MSATQELIAAALRLAARGGEVMWHWLQHKLGWNTGSVEVFWRGDRLMVGFRCHGCGELMGVTECMDPKRGDL